MTTKFHPGLLITNFKAAYELIDNVSLRKSELNSLEEKAITTFLNYVVEELNQPLAYSLAQLSLKATRKIAPASNGDADEDILSAQQAIQTSAREISLAMHSTPGHALNYGERIDNLRELLVDSICVLHDRLTALQTGLAHFDIITMESVPKWEVNESKNIHNLNIWLRAAIGAYERASLERIQFKKNIYLGRDNIILGGKTTIVDELKKDAEHKIDFVLKVDQLPFIKKGAILNGISVSLAFNDNLDDFKKLESGSADTRNSFSITDGWQRNRRSKLTTDFQLVPPKQITEIGDGVVWQRHTLTLTDSKLVWDGVAKFTDSENLVGISPLGEWTLKFPNNFVDNDGTVKVLSDISSEGILMTPNDIVISMNIEYWTNHEL